VKDVAVAAEQFPKLDGPHHAITGPGRGVAQGIIPRLPNVEGQRLAHRVEVGGALQPLSLLPGAGQRGHYQSHEQSDDPDDYEQSDERKSVAA
jgi:hypothetical protein